MVRRIVVMAAAVLVGASAGCSSDTKATVPTQTGPALGDDTAGDSGGGKGNAPKKAESASDG